MSFQRQPSLRVFLLEIKIHWMINIFKDFCTKVSIWMNSVLTDSKDLVCHFFLNFFVFSDSLKKMCGCNRIYLFIKINAKVYIEVIKVNWRKCFNCESPTSHNFLWWKLGKVKIIKDNSLSIKINLYLMTKNGVFFYVIACCNF